MNTSNCKKVNVKSSIPGRIRLKIVLLYKNKFLAQKLSETIKYKTNIISVDININTCNLLIVYNNEKLSENELKFYIETRFTELRFIQKNENNNINNSIYENEKAISKRITLISSILIGMISIGNFNIATIISIMILVSPFILFYIRNKGYKLTSDLLLERKTNLQNNSLIKVLSEVDQVFIKDNLIINKQVVKQYTNLLEKDSLSVQRHVVYGDLEQPIFQSSKILVNNLRNIGVNKIFIVSKKTNKFIDYAKSTLGINSLSLEDGYMTKFINDFSEEPLIIILGRRKNKNANNQSSIIYVYSEIDRVKYKDELSCVLCKRDILELPYLILLCKYMEITIKTTENISLAINMIGVIFAMSGYIFIRGSMIIYFLNFVFSTVLLKKDQKKNNITVFRSLK